MAASARSLTELGRVSIAPLRARARANRRAPSRRAPTRSAFGKGKGPDETVKGAVGGAVLGGLLLGPFGAVLGGQFGANLGSDRKRARQEDAALRKQGITPEMVKMVQECAEGLESAEEALRTAKDSFRGTLDEASDLEAEASELYNLATAAVQSGNDDKAREHLAARKKAQAALEDATRRAKEAQGRVERVEASVATLASQAKKLEQILKDNMAVAAERNARESAAKFEGAGEAYAETSFQELEDPLEKKFRELEEK
jgi:succinate dehydrogenase/fumarate reductase flavoprotein subunit